MVRHGDIRRRLGLTAVTIAAGLLLRAFGRPLGLPMVVVKYGGSALWAAMVLLIVSMLIPRAGIPGRAAAAFALAVAVELFRLVHAPWLDAFRLTLAGALLLGRIFSPWDIAAYAAGILLGLALDSSVNGLCGARSAPAH